jgi:hypothetical protein
MLVCAPLATRARQPTQRFADPPYAPHGVDAARDHSPFFELERSCLLHADRHGGAVMWWLGGLVIASVGLLASSVWLRVRALMAAEGYVVARNVRKPSRRVSSLPIAIPDHELGCGYEARPTSAAAANNTPTSATPQTNRAMLT